MLRRLPLIAFLMLAAVAFAPRSAMGSCGDWLAHPSDGSVTDHKSRLAQTPDLPKPCSGPLCQQSPSGPIPVAVPPSQEVRQHHHEAICASDLAIVPYLLLSRFQRHEFLHVPSGYVVSIDRPPRV